MDSFEDDEFGGGFLSGGASKANISPSKEKGPQILLTCTIKMVKAALRSEEGPNATFKVANREVQYFRVVGCIISVKRQTTNAVYTIEDGTGTMDVKIWTETDDVHAEVGAYIETVGQLKEFSGSKHIVSTKVTILDDMNRLTHHFTRVIYEHLQLSGPTSSILRPTPPVAVWGTASPSTPMRFDRSFPS
jgi:replication factor A2